MLRQGLTRREDVGTEGRPLAEDDDDENAITFSWPFAVCMQVCGERQEKRNQKEVQKWKGLSKGAVLKCREVTPNNHDVLDSAMEQGKKREKERADEGRARGLGLFLFWSSEVQFIEESCLALLPSDQRSEIVCG